MLPARVPTLLVNGSSGIAVGIATRIPPHNLREVVAGLHALIDDPGITSEQLMRHIPGPDFPTGASDPLQLRNTSIKGKTPHMRCNPDACLMHAILKMAHANWLHFE